jgi:serine/threonine protein kinase
MDLHLGERVALKLLRPEVKDIPSLLNHLHHEIIVGRRISHPNVCRIYDLGIYGDMHFISMALVAGERLDEFLSRGVPSVDQAVAILLQICSALEAAHAQGVVHRDLKPSNIMIDTEGKVTVMDFGLARDLRAGPSQSGALIGSPAYWSPEQARGDRATEQSDIYTLGLLACDLFGAKHPTFGDEKRICGVPQSFCSVLEHCLKPRPKERFASATEVIAALQKAKQWAYWRRQGIWWIAIPAVSGILLIFSLIYFFHSLKHRSLKANANKSITVSISKQDSNILKPGLISGAQPSVDSMVEIAASHHSPGLVNAKKNSSSFGAVVVSHSTKRGKRGAKGKRQPLSKNVLKENRSETAAKSNSPPASGRLKEIQIRLENVEKERRKRGILLDDVPFLRGYRGQIKKAIEAGEGDSVLPVLAQMEDSLRQIQIDGSFIAKKLERINKLKGTLRLDEITAKRIATIFAKVHERYFSGDYRGANAYLNSIWHILGRSD